MPALLATLEDLLVGVILAAVVFLLATLVIEWFKATRVVEAERCRPARVDPVDFDREIRTYKHRRDQEVMGERRRVA